MQIILEIRLFAKYAKSSKGRDKFFEDTKGKLEQFYFNLFLCFVQILLDKIKHCCMLLLQFAVLMGAHYTFHPTVLQTRLDWNNIEQKLKLERLLP